jgi:hypothetical protein
MALTAAQGSENNELFNERVPSIQTSNSKLGCIEVMQT